MADHHTQYDQRTAAGAESGAELLHRAGDAAGATARRSGEVLGASQREFARRAADQFEQIGLKMAEAAQDSAARMRSFMVLPGMMLPAMMQPGAADGGLRDLQQGVSGLVEGVVRSNLRATQELFRLADPAAVIDLQRQFMREYFGALMEGSAIIVRAVRRSAEETLRPLEEQIERGRKTALQGGHERATVADVMSTDVRLASPDDTVQQAARMMREEDTGVLPVGEGDRLVGLVTDRDMALRLVAEGKDAAETKVREVMTPTVRYVFEDEDLGHVADNMAEQQLRRLPVVNREKRLVGVISLSDISRKGRRPELAGRALGGIARKAGAAERSAAE